MCFPRHSLVMMMLFIIFMSTLRLTCALKFLAFNPIIYHSTANFNGRIADTLVEAGHEVVMLSPILHSGYSNVSSKRARIIHIPGNSLMLQFEAIGNTSASLGFWTSSQSNPFSFVGIENDALPSYIEMCRATLDTPGLLTRLREEKFDGAFSETTISLCGFGLFHLLGIDKFAMTSGFATVDGDEHITGVPSFTSFLPALLSLHGDRMSFFGRISNLLFHFGWSHAIHGSRGPLQAFFDQRYPEMPRLEEIVKNSSFFFHNTDPLIDFPQLTSPKMVGIGGIALPQDFHPLKEPLASLLDARPRAVLISFGSVMLSCMMPAVFKETIRALAKEMPNVTFIWKYEKPEDNIAAGIPNLFTSKWLPQTDILRDRRLSAFITHGGAGSVYEAAFCGVPTITVPVMADQMRNSEMLRRLGTGRIVQRDELASPEPLIRAVREVLEDESYARRARRVATMVAEQPAPVRQRLVRHFEFMARFGPLDQLNHAGRDMGIVTFYNLDIFGAAILVLILAAYGTVVTFRTIVRLAFRSIVHFATCSVVKRKMN